MNVARSFDRVLRELDELQRLMPLASLRSDKVSAWSIEQQMEHILAVDFSILDGLEKETMVDAPKPFRMIGRLILFVGHIPRGRGRSPEKLKPTGVTTEQLTARINEARERVVALARDQRALRTNRAHMNHPFFGGLRALQWVRFLDVHQHHHVKIIRDIASSAVK